MRSKSISRFLLLQLTDNLELLCSGVWRHPTKQQQWHFIFPRTFQNNYTCRPLVAVKLIEEETRVYTDKLEIHKLY